MKITNFFTLNYTPQKANVPCQKPVYDTITFGAKTKTAAQKLLELKKEEFPSLDYYNFAVDEILKNGPETDVKALHLSYYRKLLDCQSLDEAKEIYPEFQDVIDIKNLDTSKADFKILKKIEDGKIEGASLENLSLEFLKRYYGCLSSIYEQENYFNLNRKTILNLLDLANIKMSQGYKKIISTQNHSEGLKRAWEDDTKRERLKASFTPERKAQISVQSKAYWSKAESRQKQSEASSQYWAQEGTREEQAKISAGFWQREDYRKKQEASWTQERRKAHSDRMIIQWEVEEYRKKQEASWTPKRRKAQGEAMRERFWTTPEGKALMKTVTAARVEAWNRHPECSELYQDIAKRYPRLSDIRKQQASGSKKSIGVKVNDDKYKALYFQECNNEHPEVSGIIAKTQVEILKEWGFYDVKNKNYELLVELLGLE